MKDRKSFLKEQNDNLERSTTTPSTGKKRKIKIRLKDKNDPNSYECEIYDSSFESPEQNKLTTNIKSYFDILMSRESRLNFTINSKLENDNIPEENKLLQEEESEEVVLNRKKKMLQNKYKLKELQVKIEKKNMKMETEDVSSDDENLLKVQVKLKKAKPEKEGISIEKQPKKTNLLSYFTVTTPVSTNKNNNSKQTKKEPRKLKEVDLFSPTEKRTKSTRKAKQDTDVDYSQDEIDISSDDSDIFTPNKKPKLALKEEKSKDKKVEPPKTLKLAPIFVKGRKNEGKKLEEIEKLAPIFVKKTKDTLTEAQKNFLHSRVPQNLKKTKENKIYFEDFFYYPKVNHFQQKDETYWKFSRTTPVEDNYKFTQTPFTWNTQADTEINKNEFFKLNNKNITNNLPEKYPTINIELLIKICQLKNEKYLKKKRKKLGNPNPTWTEKYKPKTSKEILGNRKIVNKFKKWLNDWILYDEEIKNGNVCKRRHDSDSDDFVTSDEEGVTCPSNACIIQGVIGCGKTCLVYCLASELGFNVIEINCSSKRSGKKVLSDLQEATQSHKLSQDQVPSMFRKKEEDKQDQSRMSLILIEDADIVFEDQDEGFVGALVTLVQSSKRPVIFVSNDTKSPHMMKIKSLKCLVLDMCRPSLIQTSAFLEVICLTENIGYEDDAIQILVHQHRNDVRKCLLELQYKVLSTTSKHSTNQTLLPLEVSPEQLWWNTNQLLFHRDIKHKTILKPKSKRILDDSLYDLESSDDEQLKKETLDSELLASNIIEQTPPNSQNLFMDLNIFENLSFLDVLDKKCDEISQDGVSLLECFDRVMRNDIGKDIHRLVLEKTEERFREINKKNNFDYKFNVMLPTEDEIKWQNEQLSYNKELSVVIPELCLLDKTTSTMDYLPSIRTLCRIENDKQQNNTKRGNRFFHYLKSLGVHPSKSCLENTKRVFMN